MDLIPARQSGDTDSQALAQCHLIHTAHPLSHKSHQSPDLEHDYRKEPRGLRPLPPAGSSRTRTRPHDQLRPAQGNGNAYQPEVALHGVASAERDSIIVSGEHYMVIRPTRNLGRQPLSRPTGDLQRGPGGLREQQRLHRGGAGKPPNFVLEIASEHTKSTDVSRMRAFRHAWRHRTLTAMMSENERRLNHSVCVGSHPFWVGHGTVPGSYAERVSKKKYRRTLLWGTIGTVMLATTITCARLALAAGIGST